MIYFKHALNALIIDRKLSKLHMVRWALYKVFHLLNYLKSYRINESFHIKIYLWENIVCPIFSSNKINKMYTFSKRLSSRKKKKYSSWHSEWEWF